MNRIFKLRWTDLAFWIVLAVMTTLLAQDQVQPDVSGFELLRELVSTARFQMAVLVVWPVLQIGYGQLLDRINPAEDPAASRTREKLTGGLGFWIYLFAFALVLGPMFLLELAGESGTLKGETERFLATYAKPIIGYIVLATFFVGQELWCFWRGSMDRTLLNDSSGPSITYISLHILNLFIASDITYFGAGPDQTLLIISSLFFFGPLLIVSGFLMYFALHQPFSDPNKMDSRQFMIALRLIIAIGGIALLFWVFVTIRYDTEYLDLAQRFERAGGWFIGGSAVCATVMAISGMWNNLFFGSKR